MLKTTLRTAQTIFILITIFTPLVSRSEENLHAYTVTKVVDGDTFVATDGNIRFKVRIAAMDAPEHDQNFGKLAQKSLAGLILNKTVEIKTIGNGFDMYNRVLGLVFLDGSDIAQQLISQGLATYYRPSCQDYPTDAKRYNYDPRSYVDAETAAKRKSLLIWAKQGELLPCQFRKNQSANHRGKK